MNEFIAAEFIECNGVDSLLPFLYLKPCFSNALMSSYLDIITILLSYPKALNQIMNYKLFQTKSLISKQIEEEEEDELMGTTQSVSQNYLISNNYQQLLSLLLEETERVCSVSVKYQSTAHQLIQFILSFVSYVDNIKQLTSLLSLDLLSDIEKISETMNWKHASCENTGSKTAGGDDEDEMGGDNGNDALLVEDENDRNLLHLPAQALMEIYSEIEKLINSLSHSWNELSTFFKKKSFDKERWSMILTKYFQHFKFPSSLIALNSLRLLSSELAIMIDWNSPFYIEVIELKKSLNSLTVSLLSILFGECHDWKILFLSVPSAVIQQLFDTTLSSDYSYFRNVTNASNIYHSINCFYRYHNQSLPFFAPSVAAFHRRGTENLSEDGESLSLVSRNNADNEQRIQITFVSTWFYILVCQHYYSLFQSWNHLLSALHSFASHDPSSDGDDDNGSSLDIDEFALNLFQENLSFFFDLLLPPSSPSEHLKQPILLAFVEYFWNDFMKVFCEISNEFVDLYGRKSKGRRKYPKYIYLLFERILHFVVTCWHSLVTSHCFSLLNKNQVLALHSNLKRFLSNLPSSFQQQTLKRDDDQMEEDEEDDAPGSGKKFSKSQFMSEIISNSSFIVRFIEKIKERSNLNNFSASENSLSVVNNLLDVSDQLFVSNHLSNQGPQLSVDDGFNQLEQNLKCIDICNDHCNNLIYYLIILESALQLFHGFTSSSSASTEKIRLVSFSCEFLFNKYSISFSYDKNDVAKAVQLVTSTIKNASQLCGFILNVLQTMEQQLISLLKNIKSALTTIDNGTIDETLRMKWFLSAIYYCMKMKNHPILNLYCSEECQNYNIMMENLSLEIIILISSLSSFSVDPTALSENGKDKNLEESNESSFLGILLYLVSTSFYHEKENVLFLINCFYSIIFASGTSTSSFITSRSHNEQYLNSSLKTWNHLYNDYHHQMFLVNSSVRSSSFKELSNQQLFSDLLNTCLLSLSQTLHTHFIQFLNYFIFDEWLLSSSSSYISAVHLCQPIKSMMKLFSSLVQNVVGSKSNSSLVSEDERNLLAHHENNLIKFLFSFSSLLESTLLSPIFFLQESLLKNLFILLKSSCFELTFLSLQMLIKIYLSVDKLKTIQSSENQPILIKEILKQWGISANSDVVEANNEEPIESNEEIEEKEEIQERMLSFFSLFSKNLTYFLQYLAIELIDLLPTILKHYKENPYMNLLLNQAFFFLWIISFHNKYYWIKFLHNLLLVGEGFTIEFLSIKLWIQFEESYQYLYEMIDIKKQYVLYSSTPSLEDASGVSSSPFTEMEVNVLLLEAFEQCGNATFIMKIVCELLVFAYESNKLSLTILAKSMRYTLCDPRKVIIRYQRMFTMWMTTFNNDFIYSFSSSDGYAELLNSRQVTISLYLKHLVEITSKYSKYQLAKDERLSLRSLKEWIITEQQWLERKNNYEEIVLRNPLFLDLIQTGDTREVERKNLFELELLKVFFQQIRKTDYNLELCGLSSSSTSCRLNNHSLNLNERLFFYDSRNCLFYSSNYASSSTASSTSSSLYSVKRNRSFVVFKEYFQHLFYSFSSSCTFLSCFNQTSEELTSFEKRKKQFLLLHCLPKDDNNDFWEFQKNFHSSSAFIGNGEGKKPRQFELEEDEDSSMMRNSAETAYDFPPSPNKRSAAAFAAASGIYATNPMLNNDKKLPLMPTESEKQFYDLLKLAEEDEEESHTAKSNEFAALFGAPAVGQSSSSGAPARKTRFGAQINPLALQHGINEGVPSNVRAGGHDNFSMNPANITLQNDPSMMFYDQADLGGHPGGNGYSQFPEQNQVNTFHFVVLTIVYFSL
jgi:hypothetical protein